MTDSRSQPTAEHTPTPWRVFTTTDGRKIVGIGDQEGQGILDRGFGVWSWNDAEGIANADLVVEAVNSHAALTSRGEELEKALRPFADVAKNITAQCPDNYSLLQMHDLTAKHFRDAKSAIESQP